MASKAYVSADTKGYFQGGINGGKGESFLQAAHSIKGAINQDDANNIVAVCHDESHWNRYLHDHRNTVKVLGSEYNCNEYYNNLSGQPMKIFLRNKLKYGSLRYKFFILKKAKVFSITFWYKYLSAKIRLGAQKK